MKISTILKLILAGFIYMSLFMLAIYIGVLYIKGEYQKAICLLVGLQLCYMIGKDSQIKKNE